MNIDGHNNFILNLFSFFFNFSKKISSEIQLPW